MDGERAPRIGYKLARQILMIDGAAYDPSIFVVFRSCLSRVGASVVSDRQADRWGD